MYMISEYFIQWLFDAAVPRSAVHHGSSAPGGCAKRCREHQNNPPNCPPTSVLLVLKLKFYTKRFALYSGKAASFGNRRSIAWSQRRGIVEVS